MAEAITIKNKNGEFWKWQHLGGLLALALLCYWPLSLGVFSAKNDNITAFLPVRFHVSEALRSGHLPLWTPYMYLGYPLHGDMQGGAWNPFVWLLSIFGRYGIYAMHTEILMAIFVAGAGMYRLLGTQQLLPVLKFTGAAVYIMCGFITDVSGSNLPFLWGAALTPFCLAYYYHLLRDGTISYVIKTALALVLLLACAYPAFLILTGYILLAALLVKIFALVRNKNRHQLSHLLRLQLFCALLVAGLAAPVILSYFHLLPFYPRGSGVTLEQSMVNSFHPACSTSLLLPNVPLKDPATAGTDLISKNIYFNIFILFFLLAYLFAPRKRIWNFTASGLLFFYFFSWGDETLLRAISYKLLPLMDAFRHPSNARLYVIIAGIVLGTAMMQQLYAGRISLKWMKVIAWSFLIGLLIVLVSQISRIQFIGHSLSGSRAAIKSFLQQLNLADVTFINALVQILFLVVFLILLYRKILAPKMLAALLVLNSFVLAQMVIPFTTASSLSPQIINKTLGSFPKDFPKPDPGLTIADQSQHMLEAFDTVGISGFYRKRISLTDVYYTPTILQSISELNQDSSLRNFVLQRPYAYLADTPLVNIASASGFLLPQDTAAKANRFQLEKFWNNGFVFRTQTEQDRLFVLQQVHLPGWLCRLDGKDVPVSRVNTAFMAVQLPAGAHELVFQYRPRFLVLSLVLSLLSLITIILLYFKRNKDHEKR